MFLTTFQFLNSRLCEADDCERTELAQRTYTLYCHTRVLLSHFVLLRAFNHSTSLDTGNVITIFVLRNDLCRLRLFELHQSTSYVQSSVSSNEVCCSDCPYRRSCKVAKLPHWAICPIRSASMSAWPDQGRRC